MDEHLLRLAMRLTLVRAELGDEAYGLAVRSAEGGIARAILHFAISRAAAHSTEKATTAEIIRFPRAARRRDEERPR